MSKEHMEAAAAPQVDNSLSRKRRMALISYLAILFIVALAIVTLSLVIQIHGNTEQYNTIAEKAYGLQEKNEELQKAIEKEKTNGVTLQSDLEKLQADYDALHAALETQQADNETLQAEKDALTEECDDIRRAYDLLLTAAAACEKEDTAGLAKAMEALADLYSLLSEEGQKTYQQLLTVRQAQSDPPAG